MNGLGKVILFGEHAVVYGYPALAAALSKGISCRLTSAEFPYYSIYVPQWKLVVHERSENPLADLLRLLIKAIRPISTPCQLSLLSEIPSKAGLGSSAATAVALIRGLLKWSEKQWPEQKINELAYHAEEIFHGTPSGIDNTVATYGGFCYLCDQDQFSPPQQGRQHLILKKLTATLLATPEKLPSVVIINTGKDRETKKLVTHVKSLLLKNDTHYRAILQKIGDCAMRGYQYLLDGHEQKFAQLLNLNHELLNEIEVSCPELELAAKYAKQAGAWGTKLTGAGGGGCLIAFGPGNEERIAENCIKQGFSSFICKLGATKPYEENSEE